MTRAVIITGTDTDVGKTVLSAGLAATLGAHYWKPIQAGVMPERDSETVRTLAKLPDARILPEAYRLTTPASPHLSARIDGVTIDPEVLALPEVGGPLVVEGAGGILVPLTERFLMVDLFARWQVPVILCARTQLGTINHSLLSIEALRARNVPVAGIVFIGDAHAENEHIIPALANVPALGRLPFMNPLTAGTLADAMARHIDIAAIRAAL